MSTLNYEFALPFTKIEQELSQNQQESGAAYQSDLHPQNAKFLMCFINVPFIPRLRIGYHYRWKLETVQQISSVMMMFSFPQISTVD